MTSTPPFHLALTLAILALTLLPSSPQSLPQQPLSFKLPQEFAAKTAATGGCCEWGGIPFNATKNRQLPALIGIGVHKSGTSYLFNLLKTHPQFKAPTAVDKELLMFSEWPLSMNAYDQYLNGWGGFRDPNVHTYEMTASYLHTPGAACRMKALLPNAKFVVVLRDPVPRALSHWNMQYDLWKSKKSFWKPPPFRTIIERELKLLQMYRCGFNDGKPWKDWNDCFKCWYVLTDMKRKERLCDQYGLSAKIEGDNPCTPKINTGMFTQYGIYAAPIAWWLNFFPPSQFIFLNSEELENNPEGVGNRVLEFMGMPAYFTAQKVQDGADSGAIDPNKYSALLSKGDPDVRKTLDALREFYSTSVRDLYTLFDMLGVDFVPFKNWPRNEVVPFA